MWKKSGAWFYRGLPKYILPEKKTNRYNESRLAASLQEVASTSSSELTLASSDNLESETNRFKKPMFTRQPSIAESHKSLVSLQENGDVETETLNHGFSGLSLNRVESFKLKLRRASSKGSFRSISSNTSITPNGQINQNGRNKLLNQNKDTSSNGCGTAEVRLHHDATEGTLHCTAVRARGLPSTDLAGLADPYCYMEVLPSGKRLEIRIIFLQYVIFIYIKTKCFNFQMVLLVIASVRKQSTKPRILSSMKPLYSMESQRRISRLELLESQYSTKTSNTYLYLHYLIVILLFIQNFRYGCDILGSASISLMDAFGNHTSQDLTLPLLAESDIGDQLMKPQILISLSYNTKKRSLAVIICRCRNLPAMDSNGFSDPFVKLYVLDIINYPGV